jgi:hypothetical protein
MFREGPRGRGEGTGGRGKGRGEGEEREVGENLLERIRGEGRGSGFFACPRKGMRKTPDDTASNK